MSATHAFTHVIATLAGLATLLVPKLARPQEPLTPVQIGVTNVARDNMRADSLEAQAITFANAQRNWRLVAQLYRRAAQLRRDDPRAVATFRMAAWAYASVSDLGNARTMMEHAAEHAASGGDVEQGANCYIDAALIAIEADRSDKVPGLLRKMQVLLNSPVLPADRRDVVLRRIGDSPRLAQVWGSR